MNKIFSKLLDWYFTKKAIPYWCILLLDCFLVFVNGYIALYLTRQHAFHNELMLKANTWGILINVFIYAISFKIFHTYHGIVRYSTFHDLVNISSSTTSAAILSYGISKLLRYLGVTAVALPNFYGEFIIVVGVTLAMFVVRVAVKFMSDVDVRHQAGIKPYCFKIRIFRV